MSEVRDCENTKVLVGGGELTLNTCGLLETMQNMINDAFAAYTPYDICEFYYFRKPDLKPGFKLADGSLLANATSCYPEAWAYLQTEEGKKLCKTETEWQAMNTAIWHTNADGTKIGWNGVGGVPYYVTDKESGTLRLPDLRGMYAEAAGLNTLKVGDMHGDAVRDITGSFYIIGGGTGSFSGAFEAGPKSWYCIEAPHSSTEPGVKFSASRVVPTANQNQPRAWGALACVYLGNTAA